jgi:hypothetical protein
MHRWVKKYPELSDISSASPLSGFLDMLRFRRKQKITWSTVAWDDSPAVSCISSVSLPS